MQRLLCAGQCVAASGDADWRVIATFQLRAMSSALCPMPPQLGRVAASGNILFMTANMSTSTTPDAAGYQLQVRLVLRSWHGHICLHCRCKRCLRKGPPSSERLRRGTPTGCLTSVSLLPCNACPPARLPAGCGATARRRPRRSGGWRGRPSCGRCWRSISASRCERSTAQRSCSARVPLSVEAHCFFTSLCGRCTWPRRLTCRQTCPGWT